MDVKILYVVYRGDEVYRGRDHKPAEFDTLPEAEQFAFERASKTPADLLGSGNDNDYSVRKVFRAVYSPKKTD